MRSFGISALGVSALSCAVIGLGGGLVIALGGAPVAAAEPTALSQTQDGAITTASGVTLRQHELRLEPVGAVTHGVQTVRLRYVSTQLEDRDSFGFDRVEGDFKQLCEQFGLPARARSAPNAGQIIISLASAPTAFGETAPQVVQYFDSFRVQNGRCVWDGL